MYMWQIKEWINEGLVVIWIKCEIGAEKSQCIFSERCIIRFNWSALHPDRTASNWASGKLLKLEPPK